MLLPGDYGMSKGVKGVGRTLAGLENRKVVLVSLVFAAL